MAVPDQGNNNFVLDVLSPKGEGNNSSPGVLNVRAILVAVKNLNRDSLDDAISALRNLQAITITDLNRVTQQFGSNSLEAVRRRNARDAFGRWITAANIYFRYIIAGRQNSSVFLQGFANWADRNANFKQQRQNLNYPYGTPQSMESTKLFQELLGFMPLNATFVDNINPNIRLPINPLDLFRDGINIINFPTSSFTGSGIVDLGLDPDPLPIDTGSRSTSGTSTTVTAVKPCQSPKYWIKVTRENSNKVLLEGPDNVDKFNVGSPCVLRFQIYRCCAPLTAAPGINITAQDATLYKSTYNPGTALQVAEYTVESKIAWTHEPCISNNNISVLGNGRLYYVWYFDFEEIIKSTYDALNIVPEAQRRNGLVKSCLTEIHEQISTIQSPFVVGNTITTANACLSPTLGLRGTYATGRYSSKRIIDGLSARYGITQSSKVTNPLIPFDYFQYNPIRDAVQNSTYPAAGIVEALAIQLEWQDPLNLHFWTPQAGNYTPRWDVKYKDTTILMCRGPVETQRDCRSIPPIILDDCKKPWKANGDMFGWWNLREIQSNEYQDIEDNVNKETYKNGLYESLTLAPGRMDGAVQTVPGKTFIFRGSTIVSKETVRTEKKKIDRKVAGSDCWSAEFDVNKYRIKRLRKHYIEVYCANGTKVEYVSSYDANGKPVMEPIPDQFQRTAIGNATFSKEDTGKYVSTIVMQQSLGRNPKIETFGPNTGQWYVWTEFEYDVVNGDIGVSEFVDILPKPGTIKLNKNADCIPKEDCKYLGWQLDTSNPCGCVDIEVYLCHDVYSGFIYYDEAGNPITIQDIREPKDFGNTYAKYMLPTGYKVTGERPSLSPECDESSIKIYHPLLFGQDIIRGSKKNIMMGLFNTSQSLSCYFTSSTQNNVSKEYYYEITDCDNCNRKPYYAVSYGNRFGSGSVSIGYDYSDSPSRAIYGQNKLLCLDMPTTTFDFFNSGSINTPNDIYIINFNRDGLSHRIDPGNFEINLAELNGGSFTNNVYTGSNVMVSGSNPKILRLIDNSGDADESQFCVEAPYTSYDIVSGSIEDGIHETSVGTNLTTYGKVYPNLNLIIIDASKLNSYLSFNTVTGSNIAGDNSFKLHTSISGAASVGYPVKARNVREKTTNHYFIRIPSRHANYSTNPTFVVHDSTRKGSLKYDCFVENPVTYVTSIGLYNAKRELLAIAKLSRPIQKSLENDVLIKIRLNW